MMLPSHKRAVRQWVADALADAGKAIPLERIVWGNQDAVSLARPYVLMLATGSTRRGNAPEPKAIGDDRQSRTTSTATVSITIVGPTQRQSLDDDADAYLAELAARLQVPDLDQPLVDAGLSVAGVSELPSLDAITGQSQWETRAALDVTFNAAVVVTTTPGAVETAEVSGTTEPPTPIGTVEIAP